MLNKFNKKAVDVLILFIIISANLFFVLDCGASARQDMQTQLDTAGGPSWGAGPPVGKTSLSGIVATVVTAFLGLLGVIFLALIIFAGFEWMTAQGDEEKVTKAKDTLTRAVIGLIIIVAAYSITYFVFSNLPGDGGAGTGGGVVGGSTK